MESSDMKNMIVLKNLPSNMVEEAIIIFKETQRIKQKELIDKSNDKNFEQVHQKSKEYIVKEAEMLVNDYISKIENRRNREKPDKSLKQKYKSLKKYSIALTIFLIISIIINFL